MVFGRTLGADWESEFAREFRATGLKWSLYACAATAVLLILFLLFPTLSNRYSEGAVVVRLVMLAVLFGIACLLLLNRRYSVEHYVKVVGFGSVAMLAGVALLVAVPAFESVASDFSPLPALMFALILNYGFLRLPLWASSSVSWAFSLTIVLASPMAFSGSGQLRAILYLVSTNVLGMLLSRSIESRERELFAQRRRAETAQAELRERARAAEEAHMEKTRLLAAVSHDLRQPMMAARAYLGALAGRLRRGDIAQAERQAGLLGESIDMLAATLDHLLTAARYDSGTEPIRIELVELGPVLHRLRETFAAEAAAKGLELRIRVPDRRIVVTTDATALWRVLMNLVSNGIKFTPSDGRPGRGVLLRVGLQADVCRIDIVDTGIGIPQRHLEEIWQPYFQVANAERNRERGLGLGLFLVRRALDHLPRHSLDLRSRPGRGSRFTLWLPGMWFNRLEADKPSPSSLVCEDLEVMRGGYVLLLEDDRDARCALQELLSDWGIVFSSGATLEELLQDEETSGRVADAVITDYRLPGSLSGIDCIEALRERLGVRIPAVLITGESDLQSIRHRLPAQTTLLQKPFDAEVLAVPVADAIRNARRRERIEAGRV